MFGFEADIRSGLVPVPSAGGGGTGEEAYEVAEYSSDDSIVSTSRHHASLLAAGDIVAFKFKDMPSLGYVQEYFGASKTVKVIPLRKTDDLQCVWIKGGKTVTKTSGECIKLPACLSDMKIMI